jgi:hypothetical protein
MVNANVKRLIWVCDERDIESPPDEMMMNVYRPDPACPENDLPAPSVMQESFQSSVNENALHIIS